MGQYLSFVSGLGISFEDILDELCNILRLL